MHQGGNPYENDPKSTDPQRHAILSLNAPQGILGARAQKMQNANYRTNYRVGLGLVLVLKIHGDATPETVLPARLWKY